MKSRTLLSRRAFVQRMGYTSAAGGLSTLVPWLPAIAQPISTQSPRFAYVGSSGSTPGIHVFAIKGNRWLPIQTIATATPSSLALHPTQKFLYATHEVDTYRGLPTGAAEAYAIDPHTGRLTSLNQQPLSLSATRPSHLAVSPDSRYLAVAIYGGGAYNLLPIHEDGSLQQVSSILKETGSGPHPEHQSSSHPHTVTFDATGHLLGTDLGSDRLNVFTITEGKLTRANQSPQLPGSGPGKVALHPSGNLIYVANELDASISALRYNALTCEIGQPQHRTSALPKDFHGQRSATTLLLHPSGKFLYTANRRRESNHPLADSLIAWSIHPNTGALSPLQRITENLRLPQATTITPDGAHLFILNHDSGVLQFTINTADGTLSNPTQTANIHTPRSLALTYA
ncbi:MAG TPA: beta-propeller fold lactonase family protein [Edaphobacter sp.]